MLRTTITAAAVALAAGAASAADIVTYDPAPQGGYQQPAPYNPYGSANWTGPYAGITGGYGWGSGRGEPDGITGGLYGGYNFQTDSNLVLGIEGDVNLTGKSGRDSSNNEISNPWNGSVRGRVGLAHGQSLIYGTAGLAAGAIKGETVSTSDTEIGTGWTAGVGVEHILSQNLTGRIELRHTDLGSANLTGITGDVDAASTDATVGLGFRF